MVWFPETLQQFQEVEISGFVLFQPFSSSFFLCSFHIQEDHFWELLSSDKVELCLFGLSLALSTGPSPPTKLVLHSMGGVDFASHPLLCALSTFPPQLAPRGFTVFHHLHQPPKCWQTANSLPTLYCWPCYPELSRSIYKVDLQIEEGFGSTEVTGPLKCHHAGLL